MIEYLHDHEAVLLAEQHIQAREGTMAKYDMVWGSGDVTENCIFDKAMGKTVISNWALTKMGMTTWNLMGMDGDRLERWVEAHISH